MRSVNRIEHNRPRPAALALLLSHNEQTAPSAMPMRAHSTAVQDSLQGYKFGTANSKQIPAYVMSDSEASAENAGEKGYYIFKLFRFQSSGWRVQRFFMHPFVKGGGCVAAACCLLP